MKYEGEWGVEDIFSEFRTILIVKIRLFGNGMMIRGKRVDDFLFDNQNCPKFTIYLVADSTSHTHIEFRIYLFGANKVSYDF